MMDLDKQFPFVRVCINSCHGGFNLSEEALRLLKSRKGKDVYVYNLPRDDPDLMEVIDRLGVEKAGGKNSVLEVTTCRWSLCCLEEYDGDEFIVKDQNKVAELVEGQLEKFLQTGDRSLVEGALQLLRVDVFPVGAGQ